MASGGEGHLLTQIGLCECWGARSCEFRADNPNQNTAADVERGNAEGNRRMRILAIAVALAGLASFLTFNYANSADERAFKDAELVSVFVVKKDIPKGFPGEKALDEGYIARESMP